MKNRRAHWRLYLASFLLLAPLVVLLPAHAVRGSAEESLSLEEKKWRPIVFLGTQYKGLDPSEAFEFAFGRDPDEGGYVVVGPWHAGFWAARMEYRTRFPWRAPVVHGQYRTEGLGPFQAVATVSFFRGDKRLAKRRYFLPPSPGWSSFEFVERRPPEGTDSFSLAFGLDEPTAGKAYFAGLGIRPAADSPALFPAPAPPRRRLPTGKFDGTGYFRLVESGGSSWFVTPDGKPFYSLATDGPRVSDLDIAFGKGPEYARLIKSYGFNSLAGWTRGQDWVKVNGDLGFSGQEPLPLFATIQSNSIAGAFSWLEDSSGRTKSEGHRFPDPFDPRFEEAYRQAVKKVFDLLGDKPWFAGWFTDNEISHSELYRYVYSPRCGEAFEAFLRRRFPAIEDLNKEWSTAFSSFGEILSEKPDPALSPAMKKTFIDFERRIVERYVDVIVGSVKSHDPHRLIFSNRFNAGGIETYARVIDLYGRFDAIAVNLYPSNAAAGLSANEGAFLAMLHELTGKALIISEWSVPALDSGLYRFTDGSSPDSSWNETVSDQEERAAKAALVTLDFFNTPYVIGSHWFTWKDINSKHRRANRGLFTSAQAPWEKLLQSLAGAHSLIAP